MMKDKYTYCNNKLRVRIRYIKHKPCIELQLQYYQNWFWRWNNFGRFIYISEDTKNAPINNRIRGNPMVLYFKYGGEHEFYNRGTFDLDNRIQQLFDEFKRHEIAIKNTRDSINKIISSI